MLVKKQQFTEVTLSAWSISICHDEKKAFVPLFMYLVSRFSNLTEIDFIVFIALTKSISKSF